LDPICFQYSAGNQRVAIACDGADELVDLGAIEQQVAIVRGRGDEPCVEAEISGKIDRPEQDDSRLTIA